MRHTTEVQDEHRGLHVGRYAQKNKDWLFNSFSAKTNQEIQENDCFVGPIPPQVALGEISDNHDRNSSQLGHTETQHNYLFDFSNVPTVSPDVRSNPDFIHESLRGELYPIKLAECLYGAERECHLICSVTIPLA